MHGHPELHCFTGRSWPRMPAERLQFHQLGTKAEAVQIDGNGQLISGAGAGRAALFAHQNILGKRGALA